MAESADAKSSPSVDEEQARFDHRKDLVRPIIDRFMADGQEADKPEEYFFGKKTRLSGHLL